MDVASATPESCAVESSMDTRGHRNTRAYFCSCFSPLGPAPSRPIEEGRLPVWSSSRNDSLKAGHKTPLSMMIPANLGDQRIPLLIQPSFLVASPGIL